MAQVTVYALDPASESDQTLLRMGFQHRIAVQPERFFSLSCAFGCAHFQLYCELQSHPILQRALEQFQTNTSDCVAETRESVLWVLSSCAGQVAELMQESPYNCTQFLDLMTAYEFLTSYPGAVRKDVIPAISTLFNVNVVLMVHTETGLMCEFAILTEEAPVVWLEVFGEAYCWLKGQDNAELVMKPEEILNCVKDVADPDMFTYYSGLLEEQSRQREIIQNRVEEAAIPLANPVDDSTVTGLRQVAEWQAQCLVSMAAYSPQQALPSQEDVHQVQTMAEGLGLNPQHSAALADIVARCPADHPWEECAYVSSDLHELPCGHFLCPFHQSHLGQCPWSCPR